MAKRINVLVEDCPKCLFFALSGEGQDFYGEPITTYICRHPECDERIIGDWSDLEYWWKARGRFPEFCPLADEPGTSHQIKKY